MMHLRSLLSPSSTTRVVMIVMASALGICAADISLLSFVPQKERALLIRGRKRSGNLCHLLELHSYSTKDLDDDSPSHTSRSSS